MTRTLAANLLQRSRQVLAATFAAALTVLLAQPAFASAQPSAAPLQITGADLSIELMSNDAREIADWIIRTGDNGGSPFIIVDKKATRVFVFDSGSNLRGATTALLGLARGDESAPGIGSRPLASIPPEQRTTPAGRFVASLGLNLANQDILWVDYDTALALHRVLGANSPQHRLERLASASPLDRRITFGCVNVPVSFYEDVVRPQFVGRTGVVYILPETKSLQEVFFALPAASGPL